MVPSRSFPPPKDYSVMRECQNLTGTVSAIGVVRARLPRQAFEA
jgi:hypothetical protein